jgi:hypothetical protein
MVYTVGMTTKKIQYHQRKAAGVCVRCGSRPAIAGRTQCEPCDKYASSYRHGLSSEQRATRRKTQQEWGRHNTPKLSACSARYRAKLKRDILNHYGVQCACCGEGRPEFLTIDHINGEGNKHRIKLFGTRQSGHRFYRKLRVLGFPPGFQTLCWNCNMAKSHYGVCPHKKALTNG